MKNQEIGTYRQCVIKIQQEEDHDKRIGDLAALARKIGAGTQHTTSGGVTHSQEGNASVSIIHQIPISEQDLIQNINDSLRTEATVNMCKVASRNFWIAIFAAGIAFLSAAGAWVAALRND